MIVSAKTITALRTARNQCMIRVVQLSGCRVCGLEQQRFTDAVAEIDNLIAQLEVSDDIQVLPEQPQPPRDGSP